MMNIFLANNDHAQIIHELAHQIYYPTYTGILTNDQMDFMLQKSYSVAALCASMNEGQDFYLLEDESGFLGFMALQSKNTGVLRIEKLYLLPAFQGKGCGAKLIRYAEEQALLKGFNVLELNVNRGNKAYFFYLKQGFKVTQEIDIPYYGYILDDFIMQKTII